MKNERDRCAQKKTLYAYARKNFCVVSPYNSLRQLLLKSLRCVFWKLQAKMNSTSLTFCALGMILG